MSFALRPAADILFRRGNPAVSIDPAVGLEAVELLFESGALNDLATAQMQWRTIRTDGGSAREQLHTSNLVTLQQVVDGNKQLFLSIARFFVANNMAARFP